MMKRKLAAIAAAAGLALGTTQAAADGELHI